MLSGPLGFSPIIFWIRSPLTWFDCSNYTTFHPYLSYPTVVVVVDSHVQRIFFATEETTETQQVSPRPIKCQSRSWSQRRTIVNGSYHGDSPLLKLAGIQIATKLMPGTTNREHRELIGVKTMPLFGYEVQFLLSGVLPAFQNLNYNLQRRLSYVLPNQQDHQKHVQPCTCVCCGTLSGFPLQHHLPIALAFGRGAVAKPSRDFPLQYRLFIALAFERGAVARLSRHDQAHRLTVKRLGCVDIHFVSRFEMDLVLRHTGSIPPDLYLETHISKE